VISAIDRHFGFSGGETLAAIALLSIGAWLALPHLPLLQVCFAHATQLTCRIAADLHG